MKRTPPDYTPNAAAPLPGSGSSPRLLHHRGLYSSYPVYASIPLLEPIGTTSERASRASTALEPNTPTSQGGLPCPVPSIDDPVSSLSTMARAHWTSSQHWAIYEPAVETLNPYSRGFTLIIPLLGLSKVPLSMKTVRSLFLSGAIMSVVMTERTIFWFSALLCSLFLVWLPIILLKLSRLPSLYLLAKCSFYWFLPTITFPTHHKPFVNFKHPRRHDTASWRPPGPARVTMVASFAVGVPAAVSRGKARELGSLDGQ